MKDKYKSVLTGFAAVCWLLTLSVDGQAQRRPNTKFLPYSSVSFGAGSSHYLGDLNGYRAMPRSLFVLPRWNAALAYTRQFTPHFAARASFTYARIVGDDYTFSKGNPSKYAIQYARNLHFRNDLKEFAVTGLYNFLADGRESRVRAKVTPYLFGGVAIVAHSPEARTPAPPNNGDYEAQQWVKLQPLHTEGQSQPGRDKPYSLVTIAIPVGIGARYRINDDFNIGFEVGYRYSFSDYIDDVGSNPYPDPATLQGLGVLMSDRRFERNVARLKNAPDRYAVAQELFQADPGPFNTTVRGADGLLSDGYILTNISIQYIIPGKIKCPPIR